MSKASNPKPSTKRLLKQAITVEMLPAYPSRSLASVFSNIHPRTLSRYEGKGLTPIRRNSRAVCYEKNELLRFLGVLSTK
jgi:hypothetical protein